MNRNKVTIILLFILLLSGCWDRKEIEEIAFVLGVALDPYIENEEQESSTSEKNLLLQKFSATFQVAKPDQLTAGQTGGGGGQKPFYTITTTGRTNIYNIRTMTARRSRRPNFEHLQVIIINENLAKQGMLGHLIDLYIRDHEMRRRTNVLISKGEAKELLNLKLPLEDMSALSISMISNNYERVLSMTKPMNIGDVSKEVLGRKSFIVPRIFKHGNTLKITGAAVLMGQKNKMVGWLDEETIRGYNWLVGEAQGGILEVQFKDDGLFDFETQKMASEITYTRENEQDRFHVDIKLEGTFAESWIHHVKINDEATIRQLEHDIEKRIKQQINNTLDLVQHKYHTDIFRFCKKVEEKEYRYWQKVKDNWDGKDGGFSKAKITVDVKAYIRHYMTEERTN